MTDHGQLVPTDEDLHGRADEPGRVSLAFIREQANEYLLDLIEEEHIHVLIEAVTAARDLADLAAHVVCEPRRFLTNEDGVQQLLGEAVARMRNALAPIAFDHQSKEAAAPVREDSATTSSTHQEV